MPFLPPGRLQLVEQHVAQLLGRADVERVADVAEDLRLELGDAAGEIARQFGERVAVDLDARILHRRHHRDERPLDRLVERGHVLGDQPRLQLRVQAQGGVGALGGEVARRRGGDLGKADQALAGPQHLLYRRQLMLEGAAGQLLDRVLVLAAVEHIGHQHRAVVRRERDAVAAQQMRHALHVVADLEDARVFEQRLQPRQRDVERQRARLRLEQTGRAVPQWQVDRQPRRDRQRQAAQFGAAAGNRARRRPQRHRAGLLGRLDPVVEAVERVDQGVGVRRRERRHLRDDRLARPGGRSRRADLQALLDAPLERPELHLVEKRQELFGVVRLHPQRRQRAGQRHVVVELHQLLRQPRFGFVFDQRLAPLRLLDLVRMRQQRFEIAIGVDQLGRGLDPDARNARHVVDAVAAQRLHLDHLVGPDAELLAHLGFADMAIGHRIEHHHAVVRDELHHVLVGRDDGHLGAGLDRMPRVGRDQIVGLVVGHLDLADAESVRRAAHKVELRHQIVRRLAPVRLVLVVELVAEAAPRCVENHRDVVGVGLAQVLVEHVAEDHHHFGRHAVRFALEAAPGCDLRIAGAGEVGAKDEARAVDQEHVMRRRRRRCSRSRRGPLDNGAAADIIHFRRLPQSRRPAAAPGSRRVSPRRGHATTALRRPPPRQPRPPVLPRD